ncbi:MAG: 6-phosphogluconolactonase [Dermatophilaceae bacterium]
MTQNSRSAAVPVWDAPHAPGLRMTMTLPTLNNATRVWLLATGTECAVSVGRARTDADPNDIPAAGAKGILGTIWWLDEKAARAVPKELRYG